MPKQRITKEMVVEAAFTLARDGGMQEVTVKAIAEKIGCSVQPIYSYCNNMEGLKRDVTRRAKEFIREYIALRTDPDDPFRSTGRAYIQLTKEEPHLFRIFILHQRTGISSLEDLYQSEANAQIPAFLAKKLGVSMAQAKRLHLDMMIYTIGIGTIFSVTEPGIPYDEIVAQQERSYQIFLKQVKEDFNEPTNTSML